MAGMRVDGKYLVMENSDKPQKWSPSELLAGLRWARGDGGDLSKLENDMYDSLDNLEGRLMSLLGNLLENVNLLCDHLGVEITTTPAQREVVKKDNTLSGGE